MATGRKEWESRLASRLPKKGGIVEHHGSESYFVIGEGLLGEARGGRERTLAAALEADAPPFRFSRMGPSGINKQLGDANRKKIAAAMVASAGNQSQIPAGFTYLGQFVDHDLTFDKTEVMLGDNVAPIDLLQARSPSLDLDSMYGAGPNDPESAKFYEADGLHLKMGSTAAIGGIPAKQGFDLPRGAGSTIEEKRTAIIPDPRNDENLAVAQLHLAMIRFHNRVVDTLPASIPPANRFGRARQKVVKHYQWMLKTDYLPRICAPGVVNNVFNQGRKVFEVGAPPTDVPTMPIEFSVAAFRLGSLDDPGRVQLERRVRLRRRHARLPVRVLGPERHAGRAPAAPEQLDRRLPAALRLRRDPGGEAGARRARREVQSCNADRHEARDDARRSSGLPRCRRQPRVPEPDAGEDGPARDRPADGHVPEEQGCERHEAHERAGARRQQRSEPELA